MPHTSSTTPEPGPAVEMDPSLAVPCAMVAGGAEPESSVVIRVTKWERFYALNRHGRLLSVLAVLISVAGFVAPLIWSAGQAKGVIPFSRVLWVALGSFVLAYLSSVVAVSVLCDTFHSWRERLNGAPFEKGDVVTPLIGQHAGRTSMITKACRLEKTVEVEFNNPTQLTSATGAKTHYRWREIKRVGAGAEGRKLLNPSV